MMLSKDNDIPKKLTTLEGGCGVRCGGVEVDDLVTAVEEFWKSES